MSTTTAIAAIEKNAPKVLAEVLPFLPSALAKIPSKFRAILIGVVAIFGTYLIVAWVAGIPTPDLVKHLFDILAAPTGVVALGNVPASAKLTIGQAAAAEGEVLDQAMAALKDVPLPGPVSSVVQAAAPVVDQVEKVIAPPAVPPLT